MKTSTLLAGILMLAASSTFMSCSTGRCPMSFASNYKAQPVTKTIAADQCTSPIASEKINLSATN